MGTSAKEIGKGIFSAFTPGLGTGIVKAVDKKEDEKRQKELLSAIDASKYQNDTSAEEDQLALDEERRKRQTSYRLGEIYTSPTGLGQAGTQSATSKLR